MKILAINNYDLELAFKDKNVPLHQTWGVDYFRRKGNDVECKDILPTHGVISKITSHIKQLIVVIKVLFFYLRQKGLMGNDEGCLHAWQR